MIDFEILKQFGTTNERLREICTAKPPSDGEELTETERAKRKKDVETREKWEKSIQCRLSEGIQMNLESYQFYAAADLAWDTCFLTKTNVPLLLFAQGKIDVQLCTKALAGLADGDKFLKKDAKGGVIGIDLPRFIDTQVNIVRSYIQRRAAAQSNKYANLWPYYFYDPRGTSEVAKLRSEALSQRVDQMSDDYDYRHHDAQIYRDMLLYPHVVDFVRSSWEKESHIVRAPQAKETADPDKIAVKNEILREGVVFVSPHPSRIGYDTLHPLSSINSDTGCEYLFFWDVCRWRDIDDNPLYYNKDQVGYGSCLWDLYTRSSPYFTQYMTAISPPSKIGDAVAANTRDNNIGIYSSEQRDSSCFKAEYFVKLIPKAHGIGDYPFPVWIRKVVASDKTIIFAEIMPSKPAAYCGWNECDSRLLNISFAHELMQFQDQMTNLTTQLLLTVQASVAKIVSINTDVITDQKHIDHIRAHFNGKNWAAEPLVLEYSLSKLDSLGLKPGVGVIEIVESKNSQDVTRILQAMSQLLQLVEKLTAMSPAEQGQPAPREISATEVNEIAATTSAVYSNISDAIDEFRAAKKRIIYESLIACGEDTVQVPVVGRYSKKTIEKAGFQAVDDEAEEARNPSGARRTTVVGSKLNLIHNHIFTSRDGAERPVNTQAANTLVQLLQFLGAMPMAIQSLGKERLYSILNQIFRMSGAGADLLLELEEGEENDFGEDQVAQMQGIIQQLAEAFKQTAAQVQQQEGINQQQQEAINGLTELAAVVKKILMDLKKLESKVEMIDQPPKETLNYSDVPSSVKSQMEVAAGYQPASMAERIAESAEKPKAA